jgi:hypothetical protein
MVTYVNGLTKWYPAEGIAGGMGVPGLATEQQYNVYILAFWLTSYVADVAQIYTQAETYFGGS